MKGREFENPLKLKNMNDSSLNNGNNGNKKKVLSLLSLVLSIIAAIGLSNAYLLFFSFPVLISFPLAWIVRPPRSRLNKIALVFGFLVFSVFLYRVAQINYGMFRAARTVLEYDIPEHYTGWVTIKYGVNGAPSLNELSSFQASSEGNSAKKYKIIVPKNGRLETSSPRKAFLPDHSYTLHHYFRTDSGVTTLIPDFSSADNKTLIFCERGNASFAQFYVSDTPQSPNDPAFAHLCDEARGDF
jgi:hypothetical protein